MKVTIGLGIAAALIPVSMLVGLSGAKSILVSAIIGVLFIVLSVVMSRLLNRS